MPWNLDTLYGRVAHDISGRWHPDHDLTGASLSHFNAPSDDMLRNKIITSDELHAALKTAGVTGYQAQESRFAIEQ